MVAVAVRSLSKVFDTGVTAVAGVDLDVADGEFMVLLGPSGCGKSTLLRLIAGFEEPTGGEVLFDGVPVTTVAPRDRSVAMVFQTFALYPHLSVAQNIGFPLRAGSEPAADVAGRIAEAAGMLGITDLLGRLPGHLSGGQRQRVAVARAIVRRPAVLLLDEPMSNVDAGVRAGLRIEIVALARRIGVTTIYVTHDQTEAMSMASRLAVLRDGAVEQVGTPAEVYTDPRTVFVAAFLGTPRTSLLAAALYVGPDTATLDLGGQSVVLPRTAELARHDTKRIIVGLRALRVGDAERTLTGRVTAVDRLGHETLAKVDIGGVPAPRAERSVRRAPAAPSTPYGFYPVYAGETAPPAGDVYARIPAPGRVARGDTLTLALDLDEILLFDGAGRRIDVIDGPG